MDAETNFSRSSVTDVSDTDADEDFVFSDTRQRIIVASLFIFVAVVGTIGNFLVILSVIVSKKLRTSTNAFVVNLAVADLLTSLCVPWNAVAVLGFEGLPIPEVICSIAAGVLFTCIGCSLYTLAAIAIYRVVLITRALHVYRTEFNRRLIGMFIVLIWIIPCCVVVIPPLFDIGELGYNRKYSTCSGKSSHENSYTFDLIVAGALYPIPLVTIIGCYITIYIYLKKHLQRMYPPERGIRMATKDDLVPGESFDGSSTVTSPPRPVSVISANSTVLESNSRLTIYQEKRSQVSQRQIEITKNLFYVVCAFIICLTPYGVCILYEESDPAVPYAGAFVLFNSCINPIIYATKHPYFKQIFKYILLCRWKNIPEPARFLRYLTSPTKI